MVSVALETRWVIGEFSTRTKHIVLHRWIVNRFIFSFPFLLKHALTINSCNKASSYWRAKTNRRRIFRVFFVIYTLHLSQWPVVCYQIGIKSGFYNICVWWFMSPSAGGGGLSTSLEKVLSQFSMKGKSVEPSFQSQVWLITSSETRCPLPWLRKTWDKNITS